MYILVLFAGPGKVTQCDVSARIVYNILHMGSLRYRKNIIQNYRENLAPRIFFFFFRSVKLAPLPPPELGEVKTFVPYMF